MTDQKDNSGLGEVIVGFLQKLPALDPIIREITDHASLSMKLDLSTPPLVAELDLKSDPLRVVMDSDAPGLVAMSGPAENFHKMLLGIYPLGTAINARQLVVRGPTAKLMQVVPMFYVVPYIYPAYLDSIGRKDLAWKGDNKPLHVAHPKEDIVNTIVTALAYVVGYVLGVIKIFAPQLDILQTLESLGKGLKKASQD